MIFIIIVNFTSVFIACSPNNNSDKDYSRFVNPMVGTDWHGHTFPGATHSFGMVKLSPDTRVDTWDGVRVIIIRITLF